MVSTLLNILWLVLGGIWSAIAWFLVGILCAITIVGLPWARSCFMLANYTLWPFGRDVISRDDLYGQEDIGTGALGMFGNILWFIFAGWWLAIMHLTFAVANAITIIGIPFAWAHVKLAGASLFPVGKTVQDLDVINEAMRTRARDKVGQLRSGNQ
jgi:uncharacterized membrane protein YccF (DUF307 family)